MKRYGIRRLLAVLATVTTVFALIVSAPMSSPAAAAGKPPTKTPTPVGPTPTVTPSPVPPGGIPGGFRTSGNRILAPNGTELIIAGVNWFGFETRDAVAHGLWSKDYKFMIDRIKSFGFNTIRIPYSDEMWRTNPIPRAGACPECSGKHSRDILALIVNYAGSVGLHVILDNHRSNKGNSAQENGLWYTSGFPESVWIEDWVSVLRWSHGIP